MLHCYPHGGFAAGTARSMLRAYGSQSRSTAVGARMRNSARVGGARTARVRRRHAG